MSRGIRRSDAGVWRERADGTRVPLEQRSESGVVYRLADCPECGTPLAVDEDVDTFNPQTGERRVVARLAVCGGCSFVLEF